MKGLVLAGGYGTRLGPLTRVVSKQLLPVHDKPMVYYPLATLMSAGLREIAIISTPRDLPLFHQLLGTGEKWGIQLEYIEQPRPGGLPEAYLYARDFLSGGPSCLILGDNLMAGDGMADLIREASQSIRERGGAGIFGYRVARPERYGVIEIDPEGRLLSLDEKPSQPRSHLAMIGFYLCDGGAPARSGRLRPSSRGELEIVDLMKGYQAEGGLSATILGPDVTWLDTGTLEDLEQAGRFVATLQRRRGEFIGCPEETAFRLGWITRAELDALGAGCAPSEYGRYLQELAASEES